MATPDTPPSGASERPINVRDYEALARARMARTAWDYYDSGAMDELTLRDNAAAFERIRLRYRVLRDISERRLETTVLGHRLSMPVVAAPTAFHRLACDAGEVATARAVGAAGTLMILSTLSTRSIEEVTAAASGPVWFQLYVYRDRGATAALVARAAAAGCSAIVLTADAQIWGRRERDVRNRFQLPPGLEVRNLLGSDKDRLPDAAAGSGLGAYVTSLFDPSLSWRDVDWLASLTDLPIVVKGIVHPDDARLAAEHGARAVVVSNHGGRQLDTAPATIDALPAIADAAPPELEILLDGGVRRGTDVVKALCLGARAVAVGRPLLWGLAADGEAGARHVLEMLRDETDLALGLCGASALEQLDRDLIFPADSAAR
ncbi:MAG: alpha-hydroxy acid oxidase [Acidobacteriota bacterium]